ncbi:unnamed protein product, partial [Brassica rapa subsp. trilocularis]
APYYPDQNSGDGKTKAYAKDRHGDPKLSIHQRTQNCRARGYGVCSVGSSSFSECCPSDLSIEGYITAKVFKVFELERYRAGESMTNVLFE